jgi:ubiquitin C-terminal hydrolase
MYDFNNKNKSIISDEFYGFTNSITTCNYCQISFYNVQTFNILFFPLEEIRKYKQYNFNTVNIYDCFDYNEKYSFWKIFILKNGYLNF